MTDADVTIKTLGLKPHPEGGFYCETFRDTKGTTSRAVSTAIYYLLKAGETSHWHRIDAAEVWHWYAGAPLELSQAAKGKEKIVQILGNNLEAGELPQIVIPANVWQSARSLGEWTLVGCTVAPGFEFEGFEMAPVDWEP